ncbi:GDSL family lipase [Ramlibacter sp. AW1]|uniref:GDSL family lipase n=1 Tax=Ramlibacter aurantiacus TaxID=2801330 RepID=A0A937D752_9BURK|nr:GDSL family lipase [Ramlibacter aurantiacus]
MRSAVAAFRFALFAALLVLAAGAQAQVAAAFPDTVPTGAGRWHDALAEFAKADRERPPGEGGVLFVGSSSIRLWPQLPQAFSHVPLVINRGFGGSTMSDCHELVRQLVLQYRPRQVLVYAGENDLAQGRTPQQVLASFQAFAQAVRSELPGVRIGYISIKPSPLHQRLLPQVREANRLLASYMGQLPNAEFVDVFTAMIDASGHPRPELFGPDRLHMNEAGYAVWRSALLHRVGTFDAAPVAAPAPPAGATEASVAAMP